MPPMYRSHHSFYNLNKNFQYEQQKLDSRCDRQVVLIVVCLMANIMFGLKVYAAEFI